MAEAEKLQRPCRYLSNVLRPKKY